MSDTEVYNVAVEQATQVAQVGKWSGTLSGTGDVCNITVALANIFKPDPTSDNKGMTSCWNGSLLQ